MPLIEIATVRLQPSFSSAPPASFIATWARALQIASSRAGVPFLLYRSTSDSDVYHMLGGWQKGEDHIAFLSTPDAVELAKSIGQYMTVDLVRHIDGDFTKLKLGQGPGGKPGNVGVAIYSIPKPMADEWERKWHDRPARDTTSGGWDVSASVQKQHQAFRQMGEATNSTSAFGGSDQGDKRTWVWVKSTNGGGGITKTIETAGTDDVQADFLEMEYVVG